MAQHCAEKLLDEGAIVLGLSDSHGYIFEREGLSRDQLEQVGAQQWGLAHAWQRAGHITATQPVPSLGAGCCRRRWWIEPLLQRLKPLHAAAACHQPAMPSLPRTWQLKPVQAGQLSHPTAFYALRLRPPRSARSRQATTGGWRSCSRPPPPTWRGGGCGKWMRLWTLPSPAPPRCATLGRAAVHGWGGRGPGELAGSCRAVRPAAKECRARRCRRQGRGSLRAAPCLAAPLPQCCPSAALMLPQRCPLFRSTRWMWKMRSSWCSTAASLCSRVSAFLSFFLSWGKQEACRCQVRQCAFQPSQRPCRCAPPGHPWTCLPCPAVPQSGRPPRPATLHRRRQHAVHAGRSAVL